jgi:hypothetical protein
LFDKKYEILFLIFLDNLLGKENYSICQKRNILMSDVMDNMKMKNFRFYLSLNKCKTMKKIEIMKKENNIINNNYIKNNEVKVKIEAVVNNNNCNLIAKNEQTKLKINDLSTVCLRY